MKKHKRPQPTRSKLSLFRQLCNLIPNHLVPTLARQHGVEQQARSFSPWRQVVALLSAQFTQAVGLNDVCDSLRLPAGPLSAVRGASAPSRNVFSHANRHRDPALAEDLFWQMLEPLKSLCPAFAGGAGRGAWRGASPVPFTALIRPCSNSSPPVWTGPTTAAARLRPSVMCGWTCKVSSPLRAVGQRPPRRRPSRPGRVRRPVRGRDRVV